ncbi:hypothetical protein A0256_01995 [Mucilaginibacter sp. PAMC 26640]|nr:hypothetical protein A0256_01995 [Mucilaginibacter sp. PAMC 26640]
MISANWVYIVTGSCVLLAVFLAWQEIRRANKARLAWRMVAVLIAVVALACIALPLTYQSTKPQSTTSSISLLTNGFDKDSISPDKKTFTLDDTIKKTAPKTMLLYGIAELLDTLKTRQLHIYGDGLSANQLGQLKNVPVIFHPSKPTSGVTNISWNARLKAGEVLRVQGTYQNTSAQKIKLILKGLNTVLDTLTLPSNATSNFNLTATPKTTGRLVYTLYTVLGGDTLTQGSIPLQINAVKPLRVLLLSASPDFETKFLKNWLSEKGYAVAARSAISKDKFNTDYINLAQMPLNRLSTATLRKFDVVLGDLSVLNNLSGAESAALKQEVADKGLGVIVRADSSGKSSWLQSDFPVTRSASKETASALLIAGKKSTATKLTNGPIFINYKNGTQPVVLNQQTQVLANSSMLGEGKIVFSTLTNTYSWVLAGNHTDYSNYWSALISKAARKDTATNNVVALSAMPATDQPAELQISRGDLSPIKINGQAIPAAQHAAIPFEWDLMYWPAATGWQSLIENNTENWWYNYPAQEWKTVQAAAKLDATKNYADKHLSAAIVTKQIQQIVQIEVPKIYFYVLLLAACTFLWIESKLS